ncbi:hypothetical protein EV121DRAFT_273040 [Schizophyllum commune]
MKLFSLIIMSLAIVGCALAAPAKQVGANFYAPVEAEYRTQHENAGKDLPSMFRFWAADEYLGLAFTRMRKSSAYDVKHQLYGERRRPKLQYEVSSSVSSYQHKPQLNMMNFLFMIIMWGTVGVVLAASLKQSYGDNHTPAEKTIRNSDHEGAAAARFWASEDRRELVADDV